MDFRKRIAFFVALLMLVSNSGFAMTVHYCGENISSITSGFGTEETCEAPKQVEKSCCAKEVEIGHKKCCTDKTLEFKGKISDVLVKFSAEMAMPFLVPTFQTPVFASVEAIETQTLPAYYCDAHAPPLFKLYHQYLLYA